MSQFQHHAGRGAAVIGSHKVGEALGIVVRKEEDDVLRRSGDFRHDVLHFHIAEGRRSMEGLGIDRTAESFQLLSDVVLGAMAAVRSGRARPDGYHIGDVLKSLLAVEPSGLIGRRRSLLRRGECGRCRFAGSARRYRAVTAAGGKAQRRKKGPCRYA